MGKKLTSVVSTPQTAARFPSLEAGFLLVRLAGDFDLLEAFQGGFDLGEVVAADAA